MRKEAAVDAPHRRVDPPVRSREAPGSALDVAGPGPDRDPTRRWRIPPPVLTGPDDPGPLGLMVLEEFSGDRGLALWRQLRALLVWIRTTDAGDRRDLVTPEATQPRRRLLERLSTDARTTEASLSSGELARLLRPLLDLPPGPGARPTPELAESCEAVARWAELRNGLHTALEYRQAAALLEPDDPDRALAVFTTARGLAQFSRAEAWFHRVVGLSRRSGSWDTYIRAYLLHGRMMLRKGRREAAERSFLKALRRSRREGLHIRAGETLQHLLVLNYRAGDPTAGDRCAGEALERLREAPESLRALTEDLAFAWLDDDDPEPAALLLEALSTGRVRPGRSGIVGSLARARAMLGDAEGFRNAVLLLERFPDDAELASAWLDAGWGAALLDDEEAKEQALQRACTAARHRWAGWIRRGADTIRHARGRTARTNGPESERTEARLALACRVTTAMAEGKRALSTSRPPGRAGISSGPAPPPGR